MKNCDDCKYANWNKRADCKLHPYGDGKCMFSWQIPKLPASMYWIGVEPKPSGGYINRKSDLKEDCVYYRDKQYS